ncbi:MAG: putative UDP-N-acetylmuramoylalanine--D-glutamate ligase [Pseudomonadota bacterium]|jgi:UDP-N-acetylmuramoylalanine--D-glutamate ligase
MNLNDLKEKKIALYGFGREGQAILSVIRRRLPHLPITILNDSPLSEIPEKVTILTGNAIAEALQTFDIVIKSPGISAYRPEIIAAKQQGVIFTSSTRLWFAENTDKTTICVTGTKGKSTTSSLIAHLLREQGLKVNLGGNVGVPLWELPTDPAPDIWVIELSSYQTSDFDALPTIRVLLNLFPEHLDWHGDIDTYFNDKTRLFTAKTGSLSILNAIDENTRLYLHDLKNTLYFNELNGIHFMDKQIFDGKTLLFEAHSLKLAGEHNLSNLCAALTVVKALHLDLQKCKNALSTFSSLPHRLCVLGQKEDMTYVDDSISTTPQSALAAVKAFPNQWITLLVGGYERGLNWEEFAHFAMQRPIQTIITMPDNGKRIFEFLSRFKEKNDLTADFPKFYQADDLAHAVKLAQQLTPKNGIVILSPGAPSYGCFKNFEERGRAFAQLVGF